MRARTAHGLGRAGALLALISVLLAGCNFSGRPAVEPPTAAAPKAAAAPATSEPGPGTYSAFPGDTVYGVAQRFGTSEFVANKFCPSRGHRLDKCQT